MGYWSKDLEEVFREFNSSDKGLSEAEANARLKQYGLNDIPKRKEKSALSIFLSQIMDLLVFALAIVSVFSFFTGGETEAIIIFAIVMVNILVGFFQEYKSESALRKLALLLRYRIKVLRDGKVVEVDTRNLVPGDVAILETGARIPADLRIIEADELEIDESVVTGESFPVHKSSGTIVAERLEPQRMSNTAFLGTLVVNGKGKGIVVSTGMKTTLGRVAAYLKQVEPETNYQRNIKAFSRFLIKAILIGMSFIFIVNTLTGKAFTDSALFSLALAVGIIPESLPIIITIGLSRGAIRMSRSGVIVKKLSAIEDLGNMDVLCADKTGTLTQNKIVLHDYIDLDGNRNEELIELASYCVSIMEVSKETGRTITGNPIDVAIVEYADKQGIFRTKREIVELIPFNYTRRRMSVITRDGDRYLLICKGAPENLLPVCSAMRVDNKVSKLDEDKCGRLFEDLSRKGYRVLGLGVREIEKKEDYSVSDERDLIFLGFLCFLDPLKPTAEQSIHELRELGVEIKILTGDNPIVAKARAEEVGMKVELLTGRDVDAMDDKALRKAVEEANVFARLTPEQKARIIQALRKNGHVVGFLGDGVNDAPPLKSADLGISVDDAVDIAKEAADIILTESSLDVISKGIIEGRTTFANTTKYILNTVSANLGNMTSLAIISVVLDFLPMLPFQVLLTNLISDGPLLSI
ncbi:MAG: magnesium-translocating P-type ATPase [Candidatus Bathyarchaeia archaeon]